MLKGEFTIFLGLLLGSDQKVVRLRLLAIGTGENDPLVGRNPRVNVVGPIKSRDVREERKESRTVRRLSRILNPKRKILQEIGSCAVCHQHGCEIPLPLESV